MATTNFPGRMKLGTVGEPYPGIGLRMDPDTGEILTRHEAVFRGYWNKPGKTQGGCSPRMAGSVPGT